MQTQADSNAARRAPLSRDRIVRVGLSVADEEGVESVTMRRLGEELGFEAMSLYRHVANKDDVLDAMLDLVLGETEPPSEAIRTSRSTATSTSPRVPTTR